MQPDWIQIEYKCWCPCSTHLSACVLVLLRVMPSTRRVLKVRVFKVLYKLEIENWIEISILQIPSKCMPVYIIKRFALDSISLVEYSVDIWNIFQALTFENCSMVQQATGGIYSIYFNFLLFSVMLSGVTAVQEDRCFPFQTHRRKARSEDLLAQASWIWLFPSAWITTPLLPQILVWIAPLFLQENLHAFSSNVSEYLCVIISLWTCIVSSHTGRGHSRRVRWIAQRCRLSIEIAFLQSKLKLTWL